MNMPTMEILELVDEISEVIPLDERLHPGEVANALLQARRIHAFANYIWYIWYSTNDIRTPETSLYFIQQFVGPTNARSTS